MNPAAQPIQPALPPVSLRQDAGIVALVGLAHMVSHFSQLLLAPLFPWLKDAFAVSYAQLGFLMTVFFTVSCASQALSGFLVDRLGPRPVLFAGLGLLGLAAFGYAASSSYWMLAAFAALGGVGNGVFHPVDYTLLNRKISAARLGHAYSVHGITGSLGWALAPALLVPIAIATSWRWALLGAGLLAFAVLALLVLHRQSLLLETALQPLQFLPDKTPTDPTKKDAPGNAAAQSMPASVAGDFDFLKIPAIWMCFAFFFLYAMALSAVQAFAPEAARQLHGTSTALVASCLSVYMLCSAGGMAAGGFLASNAVHAERIVGIGFGCAALLALTLGFADLGSQAGLWVVILFGAMGLVTGVAGPSRDLLVKRATPIHATGRVYGVVYAGLDIGQAISPLLFGWLMDQRHFQGVWLGLVAVQAVLIATAFKVQKVKRVAATAGT